MFFQNQTRGAVVNLLPALPAERLCFSVALLLFLLISLAGCSSSGVLTRSRAGELLEKSDKYLEGNKFFVLNAQQVESGIAADYWTAGCRDQYSYDCKMGTKGKLLFRDLGWDGGRSVSVPQDLKAKVEVLGIADNDSSGKEKVVEFAWTWDLSPLPDELRAFLKNGSPHKSRALLVLYDDGWRVEQVL